MRFYCQHKDKNGEQCKQYALAEKEYCRWHLIPRQFCDYKKSWGGFFENLYLLIGALLGLRVLSLLWQFLLTARLDVFLHTFFFAIFSIFFLSWGMIFRGTSRIFWLRLYSISLGMVSAFFIGSAIAGVIKPAFAGFVIAQFYPKIEMQHPLFSISTTAAFGVYFMLYFLSTVFFVPISRKVYYLILGLYVTAWAILIFFERAPLLPMFFLLFYIAYLLDGKYHWLRKIRDSLRF